MPISFTSYSGAVGNVTATRVHRTLAAAVLDTVVAGIAPSSAATGYTIGEANVSTTNLNAALATAVADIVITHFQHQATAASFQTLPSVGSVFANAAAPVASATGYMIATADVTAGVSPFARATQVNDIVVSRRGHTSFAAAVSTPENFGLLINQTPLMYGVLGSPVYSLVDSFVAYDAYESQFVLAIMDMLSMSDSMSAVLTALQQLYDTMSLRDIATLLYRANLVDQFLMTATQVGQAKIIALLADGFTMDDSLSLTAQILAALRSSMRMYVMLNTGQDVYSAWVMTPESKAVRSYSNFPFNSFIMLGTQFLAASAQGIYLMGGDTDAGTPIQARIRSGLLNFDTSKMKRIDRAYVGYMSSGTLCLRVCATMFNGEKTVYTYQMVPQAANAPVEGRVQVGRGVRSVYWAFELCNDADSSSFELYDIQILPMVLTQRVP
jgi:hypothetical protein